MVKEDFLKWMLGAILLLFSACTDNSSEILTQTREDLIEEGESTKVQIKIHSGEVSTYSSTETDGKGSWEKGDMSKLELYVFRENGSFKEHFTLNLVQNGATYKATEEIELTTGNWYFYAFVNVVNGLIPEPSAGMSMYDFEKNRLNIDIGGSGWTTNYMALMGSLVREKTVVTKNSDSSPTNIVLEVGHLISKIVLNNTTPVIKGGWKGTFNTKGVPPSFMIINEPKSIYLVGQWEGPFKTLGSQVISPHYYGYNWSSDFKKVEDYYPKQGANSYWYTVENTNQVPNNENASTYLLRYDYEPVSEEIHDLSNNAGASLADKSFWVASFSDGTQLIYNKDPSNVQHPVHGKPFKARFYENGSCYYRVPIVDVTEETPALKYSVIRNHYYKLTVNSISGLGSNTGKEEPEEPTKPLDKDPDVDITIITVPWVKQDLLVQLD